MKALVPCLAIALTACAGTEAGMPGLPHSDALTVERSASADYDYLVTVRKVEGMRYDPDDQSARDRNVLAVLKDQCEEPQIVRETISNGSYLFGDAARTYKIEVKC